VLYIAFTDPLMKHKFTIAIPVYNRPEYLRQAIRSCLAQTVPDFEIVVSDDCSPDDLGSVVSSFGDSRISYHRSMERLGAARNHQLSVSLSQGEYVVNLHSDDLLLPTYLEVAGQALDKCGEAAAVYSAMTYLVGSKITGCHRMPKLRFANRQVYLENFWLEKFHETAPTCCLFRRSSFNRLGGYRISLRFAYDWDLFIRFMTTGGGVLFLPEVLSVYRKHDEQASQTASLQGLYDVLDLWQLEEYSYFPSSEIADLVLQQVRMSMIAKSKWLDILNEVRHRGLALRVLWGTAAGLPYKLRRKLGKNAPAAEEDACYQLPANLERALQAANVAIGN